MPAIAPGNLDPTRLLTRRELATVLADWRTAITWLHALVGTLTALSGLWIVLQMNDVLPPSLHVGWWKNLMRAALAGYWLTGLLGLFTYYVWYIA